jgi:hypothetical protein
MQYKPMLMNIKEVKVDNEVRIFEKCLKVYVNIIDNNIVGVSLNKNTGMCSCFYREDILKSLKSLNAVEFINIPTRSITNKMRYEVLKSQNWKCNICGEPLKYSKNTQFKNRTKEYMNNLEVAHIDHIHPYSKMETYKNGISNINERINLQALCPKCNKNKGIKQIH